MEIIIEVTRNAAKNFPVKRTDLGIGYVNVWKAVLLSISVDMAGDPKNTEEKTGR